MDIKKLQIRCLKETHIVEIRPPLQIVNVGDGYEGYSPSLATTARMVVTTIRDFIEHPGFFQQFKEVYQRNPILSLWSQITFESLSQEKAEAMVNTLPELEQLKLSNIDQNVKQLKEYSFHLPQWVYLMIIVGSVIVFLLGMGIIIWKVYVMIGTFDKAKTLLGNKPDMGKVINTGKLIKGIVTEGAGTSTPVQHTAETPWISSSKDITGEARILKAIEEEFVGNPKKVQK